MVLIDIVILPVWIAGLTTAMYRFFLLSWSCMIAIILMLAVFGVLTFIVEFLPVLHSRVDLTHRNEVILCHLMLLMPILRLVPVVLEIVAMVGRCSLMACNIRFVASLISERRLMVIVKVVEALSILSHTMHLQWLVLGYFSVTLVICDLLKLFVKVCLVEIRREVA